MIIFCTWMKVLLYQLCIFWRNIAMYSIISMCICRCSWVESTSWLAGSYSGQALGQNSKFRQLYIPCRFAGRQTGRQAGGKGSRCRLSVGVPSVRQDMKTTGTRYLSSDRQFAFGPTVNSYTYAAHISNNSFIIRSGPMRDDNCAQPVLCHHNSSNLFLYPYSRWKIC